MVLLCVLECIDHLLSLTTFHFARQEIVIETGDSGISTGSDALVLTVVDYELIDHFQ